jgi:hypothetical protein
MKIKLDANSILTLFLLICCIFFGSMWYLKGSGYKKDIKNIDEIIKKIEITRDSLKTVNKKLEVDFLNVSKRISDREGDIRKLELDLKKAKNELLKSKEDADNKRKKAEESKKRYDKLKKDPIKREDQNLINSLKEKLKK